MQFFFADIPRLTRHLFPNNSDTKIYASNLFALFFLFVPLYFLVLTPLFFPELPICQENDRAAQWFKIMHFIHTYTNSKLPPIKLFHCTPIYKQFMRIVFCWHPVIDQINHALVHILCNYLCSNTFRHQ